MTIIIVILTLGILIMAHESGHYFIAKRCDVRVLEYSFGMGPLIGSVHKQGTEFSLRMLPLGGYVRFLSRDEVMAGWYEDNPEPEKQKGDPEADIVWQKWSREQEVALAEIAEGSLESKGFWQRLSIYLAGPIMNILVAAVLFILSYAFFGTMIASDSNVVGEAMAGYPAAEAGIEAGDKVIEVDGVATPDWETMSQEIRKHNEAMSIVAETPTGERKDLILTPKQDENSGNMIIGVTPLLLEERLPIGASIKRGLLTAVDFTGRILDLLGGMVTGREPVELGGPVAVVDIMSTGAQAGAGTFLPIVAIMSLQFGIINLLPVPALDGGHITILLFERVWGRELRPEKKAVIQLTGVALLFILMIAVTYFDVMRLFDG
jgi:regulator of sigma E protease